MPLYEYNCNDCHTTIEVLVRSVSEKPVCPKCGSAKLEKQLSLAAAPAIAGSGLPVHGQSEKATCGRPQCGSGCMFD